MIYDIFEVHIFLGTGPIFGPVFLCWWRTRSICEKCEKIQLTKAVAFESPFWTALETLGASTLWPLPFDLHLTFTTSMMQAFLTLKPQTLAFHVYSVLQLGCKSLIVPTGDHCLYSLLGENTGKFSRRWTPCGTRGWENLPQLTTYFRAQVYLTTWFASALPVQACTLWV